MSREAAIGITIAAGVVLLVAARRTHAANVEAGEGDVIGAIDPGAIVDRVETVFNIVTEGAANVDTSTATKNITAFLTCIKRAEGTADQSDPYRVCYGYWHTIDSLSDHPAITREWRGEVLTATMCINAGLSPGCKSTAAGAYQIIRPTWERLRASLGLPDFGPQSQDAAAVELIRGRGALNDVMAGRFEDAVRKCRNEWASLPGNNAKQGQRSLDVLTTWYSQAGGQFA
jgi:lysozyme